MPSETCPTGSSSTAGLEFEFAAAESSYPSEYDGALFFADYSRVNRDGSTDEIATLRAALDALADKVRRHDGQLRRLKATKDSQRHQPDRLAR